MARSYSMRSYSMRSYSMSNYDKLWLFTRYVIACRVNV